MKSTEVGTYIGLSDVDLHYASVAFKERSLKSLLGSLVSFGRKSELAEKTSIQDVHALKKINLEIMTGERVGLLGRNGAGKSTFLKMVAGLYPISAGRRVVTGTVRSLFDLSLGFEPDATGRENILYRGLLLGLSPSFMRSIEAEVIEFADLDEFIDYPIRTYSAGMQVRLAFAISTAVGGDVLLLDEIVGAGDANFMRKAEKRIRALTDASEILILASHDMSTLKTLCTRGLVFDHGSIAFDGTIDEAIDLYRVMNGLNP
jgi:lipopolysaccharide transport system ATP-binding protein